MGLTVSNVIEMTCRDLLIPSAIRSGENGDGNTQTVVSMRKRVSLQTFNTWLKSVTETIEAISAVSVVSDISVVSVTPRDMGKDVESIISRTLPTEKGTRHKGDSV